MRKALLSTTALVAAGLLVTSVAYADEHEEMAEPVEPISVSLGGYYHSALVATASDTDNDRGHKFNQNIELEVGGSTTLDNGITVGVRMRVNGNNGGHAHTVDGRDIDWDADGEPIPTSATKSANGGLNTDETEVNVSGSFGRINYGTIEGAAQAGTIWSPGAAAIGGVKSPWFGSGIPGWTTGAMDEDALKISYYSPAFNGASFGVSYAPENSTDSYAGSSTNDGKHGEGIQVALNYTVDVMGGSFSANLGYETYSTETSDDLDTYSTDPKVPDVVEAMKCAANCDPTATRFGASLSIDQITIGGAVQQRDAYGAAGEQTISDAAIMWSQGPMGLSLEYGAVDNENAANLTIAAIGAGYNLGPGIDIGGKVNMVEAGAADSTEIILGTFISF